MAVCPRSLTEMVESDLNLYPYNGKIQAYRAESLLRSITKKLVDRRASDADQKAVNKFLLANQRCKDYRLLVDSSWDEELFGIFKQVLYDFFNPGGLPLLSFGEISDLARCGPGVSLDCKGNSLYEKLFSSKITSTSRYLVSLYKTHTKGSWLFASARKGSERILGYSIVDFSRLTTVPKENDIDRVICIEPTLNIYFQLGCAALLERRMRSFFGIDLANQQDHNRELARQGSLDGDFSTIDLSSASDCIGLTLLKSCLPKEVRDVLFLLRSPKIRLKDKTFVDLHMVSTMGNGFTFPLQTILFASMVRAVMIQEDGFKSVRNPRGCDPGNWGVFGDDIIVRTKYSRRVLHLLRLLGFEPNPNKTFVEGPFRESCGSDWLSGHQVRGVYLRSLSSLQDRFTAINVLNRWSAMTGIPLRNTIRYLLSTVSRTMVPFDDQDDAGVKVPSSLFGGPYRSAYSYMRYVPIPSRLDTRVGNLLRRGVTVNTFGLYISFLRGENRAGSILMRSSRVRYRFRKALTPNWDRYFLVNANIPFSARGCNSTLPSASVSMHSEWLRWKSAVEINTN